MERGKVSPERVRLIRIGLSPATMEKVFGIFMVSIFGVEEKALVPIARFQKIWDFTQLPVSTVGSLRSWKLRFCNRCSESNVYFFVKCINPPIGESVANVSAPRRKAMIFFIIEFIIFKDMLLGVY